MGMATLENNFYFAYNVLKKFRTLNKLSGISSILFKKLIVASFTTDSIKMNINNISFAKEKRGTFQQESPKLSNQYLNHPFLDRYLKECMPNNVYQTIKPDLEQFGNRVANGDIFQLGLDCDKPTNLPKLKHYDAWGRRIDDIETCPQWKRLKEISATEGLIANAYSNQYGVQYDRLYQLIKIYLFAPASGLYSCPLAMTDGAAKTIKYNKIDSLMPALKRLTSKDPQQFWTSGQWMTEKKGGSDVRNSTETIAIKQNGNHYKLYGYKWFTSATDSDIAFTLAKIEGKLSMFFLKTRNEDGTLNSMQVQKLKDKLGTRQVPTAELLLDGTDAQLISEPGRGVAAISNMLTLTRIHNALSAASAMRRIMSLVVDYSEKRSAFGRLIKDYPLHVRNLAVMETETRGAEMFVFYVARLLGKEEDDVVATERDKELLRLLTPIAKLYTAKQAVAIASEGLECFGGQGYIEDTGLPAMLRDAQVLPIWEGTTNILSLDVLRCLAKSSNGQVLKFYSMAVDEMCDGCQETELEESAKKVQLDCSQLVDFVYKNNDCLQIGARELAFSLARVFIAGLLIDFAKKTKVFNDILVANRWSNEKNLLPILTAFQNGEYKQINIDAEYGLLTQSKL